MIKGSKFVIKGKVEVGNVESSVSKCIVETHSS